MRELQELVADYRRDGFVRLPALIDHEELVDLQQETAAQIDAGPDREPAEDFSTKALPDGRRVFNRIQSVTAKRICNGSLLHAVAHPRVLALVAELLGPSWTTYGSAMVFKSSGGGAAIELHRDTGSVAGVFASPHPFFNVDIYLDRATPATGCLRVLPGSHRWADVSERFGADADAADLVDVVMEPGDVLFHDSMLLHGSLPTPTGAPLRRVLYYSYQSGDDMARDGVLPGFPVSRRWIAQQMKLMQVAVSERADRYPDETPHPYAPAPDWADEVATAEPSLRPVEGSLPWERPATPQLA
jgi:ectoine hydroxylase-related dioxygenase (phytanoyl-CoA dioxygenase family)